MNSVWFDRLTGLFLGFGLGGVLFMLLLGINSESTCVEKSKEVAEKFHELRLTVKCPLCEESAELSDYVADSALSHTYTYSHRVENGRHWAHYDKNYILKHASRYP